MSMPGFFADASLYRTSGQYRMAGIGVQPHGQVTLAQNPSPSVCCPPGFTPRCAPVSGGGGGVRCSSTQKCCGTLHRWDMRRTVLAKKPTLSIKQARANDGAAA